MSNNRDLLKEAIADAKAVKETAIANAKAALEESFTPHLKSMLSAKLEEMDKDEDDVKESEEIQETDAVDEGYDKDDKEVKESEEVEEAKKEEIEEELDLDEMLAELDLSEKKEEEGKDKMEESEELDEAKEELDESEEIEESEEVEEAEEPVAEADEDEAEDEEGEAEEGEEEEIDLEDMSSDDLKGFIEDVIKDMVEAGELEGDLDAEGDEEIGDDLDMPMMEETEEVEEGKAEDKEEMKESEETLEEGIMDKITAIFDKVTGIDKFSACQSKDWEGEECAKLKQEIGYAAGVKSGFEKGSDAVLEDEVTTALAEVEELKKELNEVNLLNAKLLYTNKIFRDKNLTEDKKVKVLKAFDKASTVKEAKVIFETLNEGLISKAKAPVNEVKGSASKVMGTAPTTKKPIVESNEMVNRFKKLAGII
jgi:hypothetical protein